MTLRVDRFEKPDGSAGVGADYIIHGVAKYFVQCHMSSANTINESFNVSSITDNGTGDLIVNLSNAMLQASHVKNLSTDWYITNLGDQGASAGRFRTYNLSGTPQDGKTYALGMGDLA